MDLYVREGLVFVDLRDGYLLCIGRKEEVDGASDEKIRQMIKYAVIYAQYQSIESSEGQLCH